ncbi:MAG: MFS transporter [Verrucomicrobiota bacterium]
MNRSFWSLVAAQCQVFINDNAAKLLLMLLALKVLPEGPAYQLKALLAALIILPFVVLAPSAGWLADRFSKRNVLYYSQWAQVSVMLIIVLGAWMHSLLICVLGFTILGLQCAVFAPAKQGIIKELVAKSQFGAAVSWIEATAIASILLGNLVGGFVFDTAYSWTLTGSEGKLLAQNPLDLATPAEAAAVAEGTLRAQTWMSSAAANAAWDAAIVAAAFLALLAAVGWYLCSRITYTPPQSSEPFKTKLLWEHFLQLKDALEHRPVMLCILGYSYFYALAAALFLTLIDVANLSDGSDTGTVTGIYMATLGLGFVAGSFLGHRLTFHHIELGLIPIGSVGLIFFTLLLGIIPSWSNFFTAALFMLGLNGALFAVPLNAHLQDLVPANKRGRILSANLLMTNLVSLIAVAVYYFASSWFGIPPSYQFFVYAVPTVAVSLIVMWLLPENLLRFTIGLIARCFYRVRARDEEKLPEEGGVLLLPNHISYIDAIVLQIACPRPIRFLVWEPFFQRPVLGWILRNLRTIPISPQRSKAAIELTTQALQKGEVVCLFPEGALTKTASLARLNRGYEMIAKRAGVPVQPVWLENLWGSIFSYWGGKYFYKIPRQIPYPVSVTFGDLIPAEDAKSDRVRAELYHLGERAFSDRPELKSHLGYEAIKGLRRQLLQPVFTDSFQDDREVKGGTLLAVSYLFSQWLRDHVPEKRVGVILPPGAGAAIVNLACVLADKTPVNLNITAGRAANESAQKRANLRTILTAAAMVKKCPADYPWTENRVDVVPVLKGFPKWKIVLWLGISFVFPSPLLRRLMEVPGRGGDREAALLFTSGSSGEPKGVVLSHRNIIANTAQCSAVFSTLDLQNLLGCLPIFHSFGFTVTFWWPIMGGPRAVTYPSPLETNKLIDVVERHKVELMINTPTFLRAYLKRAKPEQLASLSFVVTGAEKLPRDLLDEFEKKFGIEVCEGYGMTEATPVISVNLPDQPPSPAAPDGVLARRIGSVGRLLPGLSVRIRDPETDEDLSLFETGMLWLKGANVFGGYLNDEARSAEVLENGWYKTGDMARMDEDGFLIIEGRLSRFSKIAGEMAPHGTIEEKVLQALAETGANAPSEDDDAPQGVVVMGVPDPAKGEAIILLATQHIDLDALRPKLLEKGLPNLWTPKFVKRVEAIPLLASGKLDLKACQNIVAELDLQAELAAAKAGA